MAAMLERMAAYRCADDRQARCVDSAALGVLLERRTPEDAFERQPIMDEAERYVLVGDFRLDEREQLAGRLGYRPEEVPTLSDGALVMAAWIKWQHRCPEFLLGDFALAVWDRHAQMLFCARDHVGVRPLYFTSTAKRFAFASAIKGLLALADVPNRIDEYGLADYLVVLEDDLERTCYEGIRRLPAGHVLTVDRLGTVRVRRYWTLEFHDRVPPLEDADRAEELQQLLRQAVACRIRSNSTTAVLLSGGLDSSTIACLSADLAAAEGARIDAVASVLPQDFAGPEQDEWQHIRAVAESRANIDLHRVTAPGLGLLSGLDEALAINDQPFRDLFHYMTRALIGRAAMGGARNVMWGYGGDSFVSSYGTGALYELLVDGCWPELVRELLARRRVQGTSVLTSMRSQLLMPLMPWGLRELLDRLRGRDARTIVRTSAATADLAARVQLEQRLRAAERSHAARRVRDVELCSLSSRSISEDLEFGAHLAAALGVVLHVPLLDKRLVEFCLALPARWKLRDGWPRYALRKSITNLVPASIQWRKDKGPFSPDFERRLHAEGKEIRAVLRQAQKSSDLTRYLDLQKLTAAVPDEPRASKGMQGSLESFITLGPGLVALRHLMLRQAEPPCAGR